MLNSVLRSANAVGENWPSSGAIPESLSAAGTTLGNLGTVQQTFLGCSIRDFNVSVGFGNSSSTLNVNLVPDEFNKSDGLGLGLGDDVYHTGFSDLFVPPPPGSPVFFKFGENHATVEQAWRTTLDRTYGFNTNVIGSTDVPIGTVDELTVLNEDTVVDVENSNASESEFALVDISARNDPNFIGRGRDHFVFGGILQNYNQSSNEGGSPTYSASIVDPREILSNVTMILNNYSDSTFNLPNLFNVFGFLEYNATPDLINNLEETFDFRSEFRKVVNEDGTVDYIGGFDPVNNISYPQFTDTFLKQDFLNSLLINRFEDDIFQRTINGFPNLFPITGTSFSRRTENGIPFYRIVQAMNAMMGFYGNMPQEYRDRGFGGLINFRGFNYVVDFTGMPLDLLPPSYLIDYDQMNLLDFCLEVCEIISHELYVSLLPVIDHPGTRGLFLNNEVAIANNRPEDIVAGVIRIDAINRTERPDYGSVNRFINSLRFSGREVLNSNEGYELSNVSTDKFVVGSQEVDMYLFSTNNDRDDLELRKQQNNIGDRLDLKNRTQWSLTDNLKQQVLPFYGFLGNDAVSIPRGYGSYQQIMLDSSSLEANGVGNYYVTTELELRAASVSFESWRNFLTQYNDLYMESFGSNTSANNALIGQLENLTRDDLPEELQLTAPLELSDNYSVTVPRSVFASERNFMGEDGFPASPCNPPYGYPLYFKRATKIGIPEAGFLAFGQTVNNIITNISEFNKLDPKEFRKLVNSVWEDVTQGELNIIPEERDIIEFINDQINQAEIRGEDLRPNDLISLVEDKFQAVDRTYRSVQNLTEDALENANKVYEFVREAARNLGTKFLVKMHKQTNPFWSENVSLRDYTPPAVPGDASDDATRSQFATLNINEINGGPFGFRPRSINNDIEFRFSLEFDSRFSDARGDILRRNEGVFENILSCGINRDPDPDLSIGALRGNYNSFSDTHEFNYTPEPQGGFFDFNLYRNILTATEINSIRDYRNRPSAIVQNLMPIDLANFFTDQNRVGPYVRFDNSHLYNFSRIPEDAIFQQIIDSNAIIPDFTNILENTNANTLSEFPNEDFKSETFSSPQSVAFVKCMVDSKFYLPPKVVNKELNVFGREVVDKNTAQRALRIFDNGVGDTVTAFPRYIANYIPQSEPFLVDRNGDRFVPDIDELASLFGIDSDVNEDFEQFLIDNPGERNSLNLTLISEGGGFDGTTAIQEDFARSFVPEVSGNIILTDRQFQDTDHVYALITLPGRVESSIDGRFKAANMQRINATNFNHFLAIDVVKDAPGFERPAPIPGIHTDVSEEFLGELNRGALNNDGNPIVTEDTKHRAFKALQLSYQGLSRSPNNLLDFYSPSPIYPDIVALPLMSNERCYGPWVSSYSDQQAILNRNVPGRIDFIKDETLSPWNYNGYDLMNEAGLVQANFSNSLLLFSETGNISFVGLPQGNCVCQPLNQGGPLITSVDITVNGDNGVTTSIGLSLYSPRFGRLQKQREDLIARISRERQRVQDERNSLIRRGFAKTQQTNTNYQAVLDSLDFVTPIGEGISALANRIESGKRSSATRIASVDKKVEQVVMPDGTEKRIQRKQSSVSVESREHIRDLDSIAVTEPQSVNLSYNSADCDMSEGVSLSMEHQNFPNVFQPFRDHYS